MTKTQELNAQTDSTHSLADYYYAGRIPGNLVDELKHDRRKENQDWLDYYANEDRNHWTALIYKRCPGLAFYTSRLQRCTAMNHAGKLAFENWKEYSRSFPRPVQRLEVLRGCENQNRPLVLISGKASGTGKTTTSLELIASQYLGWDWRAAPWIELDENLLPLVISGHSLSRRIAGAGYKGDEVMRPLLLTDLLVIDDVDKKQAHEGEWTNSNSDAFFELIEQRSAAMKTTVITSNRKPEDIAAWCGEHADPIMRRFKERGRAIGFDSESPQAHPSAWAEAVRIGAKSIGDVPASLRRKVLMDHAPEVSAAK